MLTLRQLSLREMSRLRLGHRLMIRRLSMIRHLLNRLEKMMSYCLNRHDLEMKSRRLRKKSRRLRRNCRPKRSHRLCHRKRRTHRMKNRRCCHRWSYRHRVYISMSVIENFRGMQVD